MSCPDVTLVDAQAAARWLSVPGRRGRRKVGSAKWSMKLRDALMQRMAVSAECSSAVSCRAQAAEDCAAPAAVGGVSPCDSRA